MRHNSRIPDALLQTDIGLIALNDTHAVFSIRIALATIAENHSFLNVVLDIAGGDGRLQMPPRSVPPTPKSKWRRAFLLLATVAARIGGSK